MERLSREQLSLSELHEELCDNGSLELGEFLRLRDCFLRAEWAKVTGFEDGLAFVRVHLGDLLLQSQTLFPQETAVDRFVLVRLLCAVKFLQAQVSDRKLWPSLERLQACWLSLRLASDALSHFNCRFDFLLEREFENSVAAWIVSDAKECDSKQVEVIVDTMERRICNSPASEGLVAKVAEFARSEFGNDVHELLVSKLDKHVYKPSKLSV